MNFFFLIWISILTYQLSVTMKMNVTPLKTLSLVLLLLFSITTYSQSVKSNDETLKTKIAKNMARVGITSQNLQDAHISSHYTDSKTGIEHIYLQQAYKGIEVYNQIISLAFKDDKLFYASGKFIKGIEKKVGNVSTPVSAQDAVVKAAAHLNLASSLKNLVAKTNSFTAENKMLFSPAGIAKRDIETKLYWTADSLGTLHLTWNVNIDVLNKPDWWNVRVDALSGSIIQKDNWTVYEKANQQATSTNKANNHWNKAGFNNTENNFFAPPTSVASASYYVIPFPADNLNITNFTTVTNPWENAGAGNNATTYGWQYDGAADYTITRGNNVYAYDDSANKNAPGRPAKSLTPLPNLKFAAAPNFTKLPYDSVNRTAATINLFYWNNLMHDVMYQYGFDEISGNFQADNMNRGGVGTDYVLAEAQDGSGLSNANFNTPPDGYSGRMQMYLWPTAPAFTINTPPSIAGQYFSVESAFSVNNQLSDVGPVTGTVVYYSRIDTLGCGALPAGNDSLKGKIALIYRGTCGFVDKVKNAQNAGAIAIIMVNNVPGSPFIMGGTDNTITIPAIMVSSTDGALFAGTIRSGNTVTATLAASIPLDGDFDNGVMCHEYGHGVSNRLTGGPANASCVYNAEEAGEGWSDFMALMMTTNWATAQLTDGSKPRGLGTYDIGEQPSGAGIRTFPYSTNMNINPWTYADMVEGMDVHYTGEIWCSALWDMTWNIIQQEGKIEGNLYNAAAGGGNNIALQLVLEGMKLQPCGPGFLDARDAILAADSIFYGYKHKCAIWNAFARRGMGVSASQGSVNSTGDQTAATDVPGVMLTKTTEPVITTGQFTEQLTATCGCAVPTGSYKITDTLSTHFTYVSSTGGSVANNVVTFPLTFTAPLEEKTFSVTLAPTFTSCNIDSVVNDDRDSHKKGGFTSTTIYGGAKWDTVSTRSYSPTHAWYASDADSLTQFVLTSGNFIPKGLSTLSFWHYVNTEYSYDGGVVELQVNNGKWRDAQPYFTKNGYNGIVSEANSNLPEAYAFTGTPFTTFSQSLVDLTPFADSTVKARFKMRSDSASAIDGWYVDDITVANGCGAYQKIGLYDASGKLSASFGIPVYYTPSVLPLTLVNFSATAQGTSSLLQWQTASEINTKEFIVEASKDGAAYTSIGTTIAKGQSSNTYTLYDFNPYNGWNYYRIKMVDKDGSFTYSPVRSVLFSGKSLIVVKPNPAVNNTTVYFDKELKVSYITVTDMQGKIIKQISAKNVVGSYTFSTANLAAGTYLIKVSPQTGSPVTVKLVVHH